MTGGGRGGDGAGHGPVPVGAPVDDDDGDGGSADDDVGDRLDSENTGLGVVGENVGACVGRRTTGEAVGLVVDGTSVVGSRGVGPNVTGLALVGTLDVGRDVGYVVGAYSGQHKNCAPSIMRHIGSSSNNAREYRNASPQVVSSSDGMT